ncbi:MAG TPA: hypothetical protein DEV64_09085 [Rhodospirillaceae bacterium]|nr:hypothetical protein [Rhodospirillaceae bacterium]|tara:strand:+ start:352 stop:597 length:246 start_codon:yes stop_codon:yes gene_type:complete
MLWCSNYRIVAWACESDSNILNLKKKGRSEERPKFNREEKSKKEKNTIRLDNQTVLRCNIFPDAPVYKGKYTKINAFSDIS